MSKIKNHTFVSLRNYIKGFFLPWTVEISSGMHISLHNHPHSHNDSNFNEEPEDNFILIRNVHVLQYSFSRNDLCFFFFQSYDPVNEFKIVVVKLLSSIITRLNAYHTKKWNRWFVILVQRLNISNWLTYTCSQYFNWSLVALLRTFRVAL